MLEFNEFNPELRSTLVLVATGDATDVTQTGYVFVTRQGEALIKAANLASSFTASLDWNAVAGSHLEYAVKLWIILNYLATNTFNLQTKTNAILCAAHTLRPF